jgi:hypothetical protein
MTTAVSKARVASDRRQYGLRKGSSLRFATIW